MSLRIHASRAITNLLALLLAIALATAMLVAPAAMAVATDEATAGDEMVAAAPASAEASTPTDPAQPAPPAEAAPPAEPAPSAEPAPPAEPAPSAEGVAQPDPIVEPAPSEADPVSPPQSDSAPSEPTPAPIERGSVEADELGVGTLAVGAPEAGVVAPYLSWDLSETVAGSTFELQRRTWINGPGRFDYWSSWESTLTIADCITAPCGTSGDLDPDPGEFQIQYAGASHRIEHDHDQVQYRIRPLTNPSGYQWSDTSRRSTTAAGWSDDTFDFGTFALGTNSPALCIADHFYSLEDDGTVRQVIRGAGGGGAAAISVFGDFPGSQDSANALAIGAGGTLMYAIERSGDISRNIGAVLRYSVSDGWEELDDTAYVTGGNRSLVAGAVSLLDGRYYIGGYHDSGNDLMFRLYVFDPATSTTSFVGSFDTGLPNGSAANGDMAFDTEGNLYIVRSGGTTNVFTVTAATLAAASGGNLARSATNSMTVGLADINGIAFEADGTVYLSNGSTAARFNPTTWAQVGPTVTGSLVDSTDLASCSSPANLTIVKDVVGRAADSDQFRLRASTGNTTIAEATTVGTATGIQDQQVGPIPVIAGQSYQISEAMVGGANASDYASGYTCVDEDGLQVASGNALSGSVTIPPRGGASVVCTFRNAPLVTPVIIRKLVTDTAGENPEPGVGWSVTASAQSTVGTVESTPATPTQSTGNDGTAGWTLRYGTVAARATIAVSETQQDGYTFLSGFCAVTSPDGATVFTEFDTDAGTTLADVAPGSSVECEFTNKLQPTTLTLIKQVGFGDQSPDSWQLSAIGPQAALAGPEGTTGVSAEITAGVAYRLSETGEFPLYLQDGAWSCIDHDLVHVPVTDEGDVTVNQAGAEVTCTVTNATAQLTLLKEIEGGALTPDMFELTATPVDMDGLEATTVNGAADVPNTFNVRPDHDYVLSEASDNVNLAYLGLRLEQLVDGAWIEVDDPTAAISVPIGEHHTYRFVNTQPTPFALPITGGIGSDLFGYGGAALLLAALLAAVAVTRGSTFMTARPGGRHV